jgi:hypothetical protein
MINRITMETVAINIQSDFEIRRTEWAESDKGRKYCQVCRSGCPTNFFICVFCFASEMQMVCRNDYGQLGISEEPIKWLNTAHLSVCSKPGPGFPKSYVMVVQ